MSDIATITEMSTRPSQEAGSPTPLQRQSVTLSCWMSPLEVTLNGPQVISYAAALNLTAVVTDKDLSAEPTVYEWSCVGSATQCFDDFELPVQDRSSYFVPDRYLAPGMTYTFQVRL